MDWTTFWIVVLIVLAVIALILLISLITWGIRKRAKGPSHVELYFDENFRKIMDEWDMVTRDKVKSFKTDITKRLSTVGKDIDVLEDNRKDLDKRMSKLDKELTKLEGF